MSQDPSQPYQKPPPFSDLNLFQDTALYLDTTFFFNQAHDPLHAQTQPAQTDPLLLSLKSSSDIHHFHPHTLFFKENISVSVSSRFQIGKLPSCHFFCPAAPLQIAVLRQPAQETKLSSITPIDQLNDQ